jgi:hypothetical protein
MPGGRGRVGEPMGWMGQVPHQPRRFVLLVRLPDAPVATAGTEFTSDYASVPAGRRFVAARLDDWACSHVIETATLPDRSRNLPQPRLAGPTDESGRGLNLLDVLATSWGARATADGKDVWFTLAV